jgi:hypothetical protein
MLRPAPLARDHERPRARDELDLGGVDPRKLRDDDELDVGPVAVDLGTESAAQPAREREDLPEVGEELLDLLGGVLQIASLLDVVTVPLVLVIESWPPGRASFCAIAGRSSDSGSP